jgi:hypothetical protein
MPTTLSSGLREEHILPFPREQWKRHGVGQPGKGEARRKEHSQPNPCLDLRSDRDGGEARIAALRRAKSRRRGRYVSRDGTEKCCKR